MKHLNKTYNLIMTILSYGLGAWLVAGLFGFWGLLPQSLTWTLIKIISALVLVYIMLMRAETAEDESFRKQLLIVGQYVLGTLVALAILALLYFSFGFSFNGITDRCYPYPWGTQCP